MDIETDRAMNNKFELKEKCGKGFAKQILPMGLVILATFVNDSIEANPGAQI